VRGEGSRVYKHAHLLRETLGLGGGELAVLSVLTLRGPQTAGELRTRSERQHPFASVEEVEAVLVGLAGREPPLVRLLSRQPGQREARWTHLLGATGTPEREAPRQAPVPERTDLAAEVAALRGEVAELRARLEALEARE
jgi:hypothetical protein